ncbi:MULTISPECIES: hypothetical protein [Cytobacillus]|uniref:Uncharacterized protein n=1 Tax=Cytobacillus kochii TaxID=859143 RepID=A0A248TIV9_9BACI|nr:MULTISPECIES: hypothetical protein [Cytobacillus]ASV68143.1 hypothetical protein CKF48_12925 [Cytobacillus kochii]MEA1853554.1 hypothetical protein [Cytobacillus sp. OWB-43]
MIVIICLLLGSVLAIFGQDFAYSLHAILPNVYPLTFLAIVTISSYLFYMLAIAITFYRVIKHKMKVKYLEILGVVVIISFIMSIWSTFVLAMWWS